MQNRSINIMHPNGGNMFMMANRKAMEIIASIHVSFIWWLNFDSKENGAKKSFSRETKAWISCILMKKISLWWPIIKEMKINMSIHVSLNWRIKFDSIKNGGKKSFSRETKASISCILMRRTCLWWPIVKEREIITSIHVCLIW